MSRKENAKTNFVRITKEDGDSMNYMGNKTNKSLQRPHARHDVSRRCFTKGVSRVIGLVALSHFSLIANNVYGEEQGCLNGGAEDICDNIDPDYCPGGNEPEDECDASGDSSSDECPGENMPADVCPDPGSRANDECNVGSDGVDVCTPNIDSVDQCESGMSPDDACPPGGGNSRTDYCPGGQTPGADDCPPNGGTAMDECPGGGADVDTCTSQGEGNECSPEMSSPGDDCNTDDPDHCFLDPNSEGGNTDDVCTSGINTTWGEGPDDTCGPALGVGPYGDDVCIDGSTEQDKCEVNSTQKEVDVCPGGGTNVDVCAPNDPNINSDDYCLDGQDATDECKPLVGEEDECPGGGDAVDVCSPPIEPDECPSSNAAVNTCTASVEDTCSSSDKCSGGGQVDDCTIESNDGCALMSTDTVE